MFDYVFVRGEGMKGASYKYTWRPDWRMPPGVKGSRVAIQVVLLCALAAVPVWVLPLVVPTKEKKPDIYMIQKQKAREERMRWIQADDMPVR